MAAQGRPDLTTVFMLERRHAFLSAALSRLAAAREAPGRLNKQPSQI
jgi:hypothetical protein